MSKRDINMQPLPLEPLLQAPYSAKPALPEPLSQQLAAADALKESFDLMEDIPQGIAVYSVASRCFTYASRRFAKAYGVTPAQVIGKDAMDFMHPEAVEAAQPFVQELLKSGKTVMYVQPNSYADDALWAQVILIPKLGASGSIERVVILISDITEQRRAERALLEHRQRLLAFMQASEEGIAIHRDGIIIDVNPAMCRMVGYSEQDVIGTEVLKFVAPSCRSKIIAYTGRNTYATYDNKLLHKDGSEIAVEQMGRTIIFKGEQVRMTIVRDARERIAAQERIHYLAHYDELTSLPNRTYFMSLLNEAMSNAQLRQQSMALLFLDLDKFKRINDSLGHGAGDEVLHVAAQRIHNAVNQHDVVARFAGDEFVVLLSHAPDHASAKQAAERIMQQLIAPVVIESHAVPLSASAGIAMFPEHGNTPKALIAHADAAVLTAKRRGPGSLQFYTSAMSDAAYHALLMEQELQEALRLQHFEVFFQPQVNSSTGQLVGLEALLRWHHPRRGLMLPGQFIPVAEDRQIMHLIDNWVLNEVVRTLSNWRREGLKVVPVSVNLSSQQFEARDFTAKLAATLAEHALPAELLELELTERILMEDVSLVRERLAQLRRMGVRVSVDDFGTGFSSLAHLKQYDLDRLKIDQSFVRDLPDAADSVAITRAIVQMAHSLGISVIAEGVESQAQRQCLIDMGCDDLQGYLFGRAEPVAITGILLR